VPDQDALERLVAPVAAAAKARNAQLCAFGEMVSLLWDEGNTAATIELERAWNEVSTRHPFSLLCTYPSALMDPVDRVAAFAEMCGEHDDVVTDAPLRPDADRARRFPRATYAPRLVPALRHGVLRVGP
jgi:hypothetical protein